MDKLLVLAVRLQLLILGLLPFGRVGRLPTNEVLDLAGFPIGEYDPVLEELSTILKEETAGPDHVRVMPGGGQDFLEAGPVCVPQLMSSNGFLGESVVGSEVFHHVGLIQQTFVVMRSGIRED